MEISWEERKKIVAEAKSHMDDDEFYGKTVAWYYDEDHSTRSITPFSNLTVEGYVQNRLDETTLGESSHRGEFRRGVARRPRQY